MPIVRIDKTTNYTSIQNNIFRDSRLSLKACGLLCKMLSHNDQWNFTIVGLAASTKDGRTVVSNAVKELEALGYLVRKVVRDHFGRIVDTEYWIYESPNGTSDPGDRKPEDGDGAPDSEEIPNETPDAEPSKDESDPEEKPVFFVPSDTPSSENPNPGVTETENCAYRNNIIRNNIHKKEYTKNPNHSFSQSNIVAAENLIPDVMEYETAKKLIRENVDYETVCEQYPQDRVDEIVEIAAEVVCMPRKTITLGTSIYPFAIAKDRILALTANHVRYIIDSINGITHKIHHIKPYLTKTILEAGTTIQTHRVNDTPKESSFENSSFETDSFFAAALKRAYGN